MNTPKTVLIAQALISFQMAALMTGIFSFLEFGLTTVWLEEWSQKFVTAWPIAFVLSIFVSKIAFDIAIKVTKKRTTAL